MLGPLPTVFAGLEPSASREAEALLEDLSLPSSAPVIAQGEEDRALAFIERGAVRIMDGATHIGTAGVRDMLGEIELFGGMPRIASAVSASPVSLRVLSFENYLRLCELGNPAIYNIERFAQRRIIDRLRWMLQGVAARAVGREIRLQPRGKGLLSRINDALTGRQLKQDEIVGVLQASPLFDWADPSVLAQLAAHFSIEHFEPEQVLAAQGRPGDKFYVVAEGNVESLLMLAPHQCEPIMQVEAGFAFGDIELSQNAPLSSTYICREPVTALSMNRAAYVDLFAMDDPVGSVLRQALLRNAVREVVAVQKAFVRNEQAHAARIDQDIGATPMASLWRN